MGNVVPKTSPGKQYPTPDALVLFVTGRCNARCGHCFYSGHLNGDDDKIGKVELTRILGSLSRPTTLSLTGGEPFTRSDFAEILNMILSSPIIHAVSINSNGFLPNRTKSVLTEALVRHSKSIHIQLSLDGSESVHDKIRGVPGGFQKVLSTAEWIAEQAKHFSALSITISITVMGANLDVVESLIDTLQKRFLRSKITFVRGNTFSTFKVPERILKHDYDGKEAPIGIADIEVLVKRLQTRFPDYFDDYGLRKIEATLFSLKHHSRMLPCYAGDRDGVIYHDGHIGICEQVVPFGHLSSWEWDVTAAWNSKEAERQRKMLKKCACIHGCNISTTVSEAMARETNTEKD